SLLHARAPYLGRWASHLDRGALYLGFHPGAGGFLPSRGKAHRPTVARCMSHATIGVFASRSARRPGIVSAEGPTHAQPDRRSPGVVRPRLQRRPGGPRPALRPEPRTAAPYGPTPTRPPPRRAHRPVRRPPGSLPRSHRALRRVPEQALAAVLPLATPRRHAAAADPAPPSPQRPDAHRRPRTRVQPRRPGGDVRRPG